jgi:hypothetical protein
VKKKGSLNKLFDSDVDAGLGVAHRLKVIDMVVPISQSFSFIAGIFLLFSFQTWPFLFFDVE